MIVIDTSAVIALLNNEFERTGFFETIWSAYRRTVSALTDQEAGQLLMARRGVSHLMSVENYEQESNAYSH